MRKNQIIFLLVSPIFFIFIFIPFFNLAYSQSTWQLQYSTQTNGSTREFKFFNDQTGYLVGHGDLIIYTTTGGNNWIKRTDLTGTFEKIIYINDSTGILVGRNELYKTTNTGESWSLIYGPGVEDRYFMDMQVINETEYLLFGKKYIRKTTDGGLTWEIIYTGPFIPNYEYILFTSVNFINSNEGFVTFTNMSEGTNLFLKSGLYKTTDGGATYNLYYEINTHSSYSSDLKIFQNGIGYFNSRLSIVKTTDYGNSWKNIFFNSQALSKLHFITSEIGWVKLYYDRMVYKTTNSGNFWQFIGNINNQNIENLEFINSLTGWIVTKDYSINQIYIYKTNDGGILNVSNTNSLIPEKFYLKQNYPNPFNPETNIEFGIKNYSEVNLTVYDISGIEILKKNFGNMQPGNYNYKFNGLNLPSGIYFYKLNSGNYSFTNKMTLLK
ncbi:MAG TPA: T9SS type A sorting domain-containing protein [Ignavibacteria bacterium]|nr:T9SS type A sorting domain-containing protein [Ignavibacteria bacterium]